MSAQFSLSEPVLTAKCDLQHTFANPCLKRKLETEVKNGFVAVQHHEMCSAEQEYNFISEKRPRFSNCFPQDELGIEINRNQGLRNGELNYFPTVVDNCSNTAQHGNNMGADSLLQNNSEWKTSCENEEATGMDVECETDGESCPPNSNIGSTTVVPSDPCSSNESTPVKGSPAREFLSKYRPEYQMYCIPSYCHPGGLWDVMLEVYHGL